MQYFRIFFALNEDLSDLVKTKTGEIRWEKVLQKNVIQQKSPWKKKQYKNASQIKWSRKEAPKEKSPSVRKYIPGKKPRNNYFRKFCLKFVCWDKFPSAGIFVQKNIYFFSCTAKLKSVLFFRLNIINFK